MEFKQLGINQAILKVLAEQQYEKPTQIQAQTIPAAMAGKDVLGLAQTGSGKTAAFAIPTLQQISNTPKSKKGIKSLILTPTRELAVQIQESFDTYGRYLSLKTTVIFGGVNQAKQVKEIKGGVDILVATPGRLLDLINQRIIDLSHIEIFILDEADRMLDMGFIHDIKKVIKLLPAQKQTLLFSATMPKEIDSIAQNLLQDPFLVKVNPVSSTVDTIDQSLYYVDRPNKLKLLVEFFQEHPNQQVLIFTRTKRGSDKLMKDLSKSGILAKAIHGNKSQNARQIALNLFKNNEIDALIATDIVSRGIDINELNYVINYDLPEQAEDYVHRIGRTGRAGKSGTAISYCSYQEIPLLQAIEKLTKKKIKVAINEAYPLVDKTEKEKKTSKPKRTVQSEAKPSKKAKPAAANEAMKKEAGKVKPKQAKSKERDGKPTNKTAKNNASFSNKKGAAPTNNKRVNRGKRGN